MAKEGADVSIVYLPNEQEDADYTKSMIEKEGRTCLRLQADLRDHNACRRVVEEHVKECVRRSSSQRAETLTLFADTAGSTFLSTTLRDNTVTKTSLISIWIALRISSEPTLSK